MVVSANPIFRLLLLYEEYAVHIILQEFVVPDSMNGTVLALIFMEFGNGSDFWVGTYAKFRGVVCAIGLTDIAH